MDNAGAINTQTKNTKRTSASAWTMQNMAPWDTTRASAPSGQLRDIVKTGAPRSMAHQTLMQLSLFSIIPCEKNKRGDAIDDKKKNNYSHDHTYLFSISF